jgi:hypothetical protein
MQDMVNEVTVARHKVTDAVVVTDVVEEEDMHRSQIVPYSVRQQVVSREVAADKRQVAAADAVVVVEWEPRVIVGDDSSPYHWEDEEDIVGSREDCHWRLLEVLRNPVLTSTPRGVSYARLCP